MEAPSAHGMTGIYFDWIRMLYANMKYRVKVDGGLSDAFSSSAGVLIGDPASPTLWNLYLSSFTLPILPGDVPIAGVYVNHVVHADDLLVFTTLTTSMQQHVFTTESNCDGILARLNADKTGLMIHGTLPLHLPKIRMAGTTISVWEKERYIGVIFRSTDRNIFLAHYEHQAQLARGCAFSLLSMDHLIGASEMPLDMAKTLYMATIDCHLIWGCEVMPDVGSTALLLLESVQKDLFRRLLAVGKRSPIAPLFSELGVLPIAFRRASLCVRHLRYLATLPDSHFAKLALREATTLARRGFSSWLSDLELCLIRLTGHDHGIRHWPGFTDAHFERCLTQIVTTARDQIETAIHADAHLYLLQDRLEPSEDDPPRHVALCLRHYLTRVPNVAHRKALTWLLWGLHNLAVRRLRFATPFIPRERRLCRFCRHGVETPEHVLLVCHGSRVLLQLRQQFLQAMTCYGFFTPLFPTDDQAVSLLKGFVAHWDAVAEVAAFVFKVLDHCDSVPLYIID